MLAISLLGVLEITVDEESIEVDSNYVRALLCFLVLEKHRPHRREALAELLWPEKPEGVARNSLKQALSNLRKALGDRENPSPYLLVTRDEIQFNQCSDFRIDALAFTDEIEAYEDHPHDDLATCKVCKSHLKRAVELYGGDFLSDFYLPENQEFCNWIILKREVFQRQVADAFSKLALIYKDQGEVAQAIEYSRQLAELEPWNEENHRNLMRLLALNGMRSAALRQFQICNECLEKELDVSPSSATVALYEEIKAWESGVLSNGEPSPTLVRKSDQKLDQELDTPSKPFLSRRLLRPSLIALIVAGFALVISSVYWISEAQKPLTAVASKNDIATQAPYAGNQTISPSLIPTKKTILGPASAPASAIIDNENQLQALIALYEYTDGPNWENSDGWFSELSPCEWHGVTCSGEKIIELELTNNQLNGSLPSEIDHLEYLENLDLRNNFLTGNLPPELGNLSRLRHLFLSGNRELSGPIPPELGNLSNLEDLELAVWDEGGSLLSGEIPPELGKLANLRTLRIGNSLLHGHLPKELGKLTNLTLLDLTTNRLSGPVSTELENLKYLNFLDLGNNDFEGPIPPELGNLTQLHYFAVGGNLVSGEIPAELGNLVRLRNLVLDNTNLSGPLPLTLMNLNLREFTFWGTDVCEPADEDFQNWLDAIYDLQSSGITCVSEGD